MGDNGNGNKDMPWWIKAVSMVGVPTIISFYLLGIIPGVRSPFDKVADEFKAAAQAMNAHELTAREQLRVARHICRGIWKDNPVAQASCSRGNNEFTDLWPSRARAGDAP